MDTQALIAACEAAVRAIPPLWPLSASVAVNPFLGQAEDSLAMTSARLGRVAGQAATMPRHWYARRIARGEILDRDLEAAREAEPSAEKPASLAALKASLNRPSSRPAPVPTVADLATQALGIDCPRLVAERIGFFAANFFDEGQAMWPASRAGGAFMQWRAFATRDLTPEIIGVPGFAAHVDQVPDTATEAIRRAAKRLNLQGPELPTYLHTLLISLGGWAQFGRLFHWKAELAGDADTTALELLAIRLVWEEALFDLCEADIGDRWRQARAAHAKPLAPVCDDVIDTILQEAAERAAQRQLAARLATPGSEADAKRPQLHAVFCIDVRSEVFRRALEGLDAEIRTAGFAGFFGLPTAHRGLASDIAEPRLPVLLSPSLSSHAEVPRDIDLAARYLARAKRAWGRFKLAAVSSFAFVEAAGPLYVAKLLGDALGKAIPRTRPPAPPGLDPAVSPATRVELAASILRAMSLTGDFAPVVLLVGHGADVVNNPHASALRCGACGGYSGEVNARLLARLLNESDVRSGLRERGIRIPADTVFLGARHDTTTDRVEVYEGDVHSPGHAEAMRRIRGWLEAAGVAARTERARRLPRATRDTDVLARGQDWSEIRPEWALAGCQAFIAAPRSRTAGKDLAGRAFLHDYDWQRDDSFSVLELIMTAPVVVASWISLQYYGSTVAPKIFGGGNKLLHNVAGGIGVVEGNGGLLRPGLPWQSVHDGEDFVHEPLRLSVCIEAPVEAMNAVLRRHEHVRSLFDNRWLHLFALDESGQMALRYDGDLEWVEADQVRDPVLRDVA